jgi:hypothetical protein
MAFSHVPSKCGEGKTKNGDCNAYDQLKNHVSLLKPAFNYFYDAYCTKNTYGISNNFHNLVYHAGNILSTVLCNYEKNFPTKKGKTAPPPQKKPPPSRETASVNPQPAFPAALPARIPTLGLPSGR